MFFSALLVKVSAAIYLLIGHFGVV